jgi:hypothetical protein
MESRRKALVREALSHRLHEVWTERLPALTRRTFGPDAPRELGELKALASVTAEASLGASLYQEPSEKGAPPSNSPDFNEELIRLALGRESCGPQPDERLMEASAESFLAARRAAKKDPLKRFGLLAERYSCPLNIKLDSHIVREALLEELMVQDRARIERATFPIASAPDMLCKLNLMAVYTANQACDDLRYLDALNYYYEILGEERERGLASHWLYITFLLLYARTLSAWVYWKLSE